MITFRNSAIWKPAPSTPLCVRRGAEILITSIDLRTSIAVTKLIAPVFERNGLPGATASLVTGHVEVGKEIVGSIDIPLGKATSGASLISVSFTGSEKVGKEVGKVVMDRFGKVNSLRYPVLTKAFA